MRAASTEFDRLFEEILAVRPARPGGAAAPPPDPARVLRRVAKLFYSGEYGRCLAAVEQGEQPPSDPRLRAFWGACRAVVRADVNGGLQACVEAVRAASLLPDPYCALGTALLAAGDRAKARGAFLKGLSVDPRHPHLRANIRRMGIRRPPVVRFLPRSHPVNRVLGRWRARLAGANAGA